MVPSVKGSDRRRTIAVSDKKFYTKVVMRLSTQQLFPRQILTIITIVSVLILATVGMHEMTATDGEMSTCPLMNKTAMICSMSIMEHLAQWQSLTRATIPASSLLFALGAVMIVVFVMITKRMYLPQRYRLKTAPLHLYDRYRFIVRPFDRMLAALSRGIIQSKLFA